MSSTSIAGKADRRARRPRRRSGRSLVVLPVAVVLLVAIAAVVLIAYVLWPRWPSAAVAPDAPALPITIGGVAFNVPPAAIRVPVQRRHAQPGTCFDEPYEARVRVVTLPRVGRRRDAGEGRPRCPAGRHGWTPAP